MDAIRILSTVVMVATGATIVLAVSSYMVYRLRDLRKHKKENAAKSEQKGEAKYFTRYYPDKNLDSEK